MAQSLKLTPISPDQPIQRGRKAVQRPLSITVFALLFGFSVAISLLRFVY